MVRFRGNGFSVWITIPNIVADCIRVAKRRNRKTETQCRMIGFVCFIFGNMSLHDD